MKQFTRTKFLCLAAAAVVGAAPAMITAADPAAPSQPPSAGQDKQPAAQSGGSQKDAQQKQQPPEQGKQQQQQQQQPTADKASGQAGQPTPAPAARVSPDAKAVLKQVRDAYTKLQSLQLDGSISTHVDVGGQQQKSEEKFTASFQAPNKFRHELGDKLVVGSSGTAVFAHSTVGNSFVLADAPDPRAPAQDLPRPLPEILQAQNPSLMLAVQKDPMKTLGAPGVQIDKAKDVNVDGKSYTALTANAGAAAPRLTILIDPDTHLIRRITTDLKPAMARGGAADVKAAELVIDYATVKTGAEFKQDHFAWSPPDGAQDAAKARPQAEQAAATGLTGKPAPDFKLDSLAGKSVSLSDLKGNVVVLDFWASWCPPCVQALPHLGQLYQQKDDGVKVFAVNLRQDKADVQAFMNQKDLQVPVLLDKDGQVARTYGVAAIPQTVLIGKDGQVKKVYVGMGPDTFAQLRQDIDALKGDGSAVPASSKQEAGGGGAKPKAQ